ncbi:helix-turn-helix transcriptional regulator [Pyxidicoccus xibeiensis]|uniref:helix-turn-helix transcriptional regulator n=1 Tax=Pyxidicoccus xibeiensis TaxID=2906759 RepID=UPI0020A72325|nr:helix-turn-helix domain-containing protein [Pyxidicoccus xibeiensis]MCP3143832.1 AraC family transcriptional regulator [Pyxidicoccus xibeiensis]
MVDQGTLTSSSLSALLHAAVARDYPELQPRGRDKVALLQAVLEAHGWRPVLALGRELRALADHPVIRAITTGPTPRHIVERWQTLERFGHSRHRTRLLHHDADGARMTVRHVAIDGGTILAVNDLFIWGAIIALLELAGFTELVVTLTPEAGAPVVIHGGPQAPGPRVLPDATDLATIHWKPAGGPRCEASPGEALHDLRTRLQQLLRGDLLHPWTLEEAAVRLSLSRRSLQRALRQEGTTFSEMLQRSRVAAAHALLGDERLTLTDVAFCTGFADHAHFTRTFRRYNDVPPSALRELLR